MLMEVISFICQQTMRVFMSSDRQSGLLGIRIGLLMAY